MKRESEFDLEVCHKALLIAKAEFKQYGRIYSRGYQAEDLEHDLICHYLTIRDKVLAADSPIDYAVRCLYREKDKIHREKADESRIYIDSEIFDGRILGNDYFDLLVKSRKESCWNDNEKVIGPEERRKTLPDRPLTAKSEFSELDMVEAWRIVEETLNPEDRKVLDLYLDGRTEREMAEATGKSHQAIHKQLERILKRLTNKGA